MESQYLFIELMHRLRNYVDASVLYVELHQHADEVDFKTTAAKISLDYLGGRVEKKQVQRSLDRMVDWGLLEVQVHSNYRTHIKVDRDAVMALLRQPVSPFLPGLRADGFPFLDHVNSNVAEEP